MLQPQTAPFNFFPSNVPAQSYVSQPRPLPQLQPAQQSPVQHQPNQNKPAQHVEAHHQSIQPSQLGGRSTRSPTPTPPTQVSSPQTPFLYTGHANAPNLIFNGIPSSEFAQTRGTEWSNAVQQRAREIAAKITARGRDTMAQVIMQKH